MFNNRQKKMMECLGLKEADFKPRDNFKAEEDRIAELENAILELAEILGGEE